MQSSLREIFNSIVYNENRDYSFKKWILLILAIKLPLFVFYVVCSHLYPENFISHGFLYVFGGDTSGYYPPLVEVLNGGSYGGACRMPGLGVTFAPFYLLTKNAELSYEFVVVIQFILSTISVYILGLIANLLFNNHRIFLLTIILYSLWYHIGDHLLMADSISNSTFIFAFYFFLKAFKSSFISKKDIFLSGVFFTWSIFSRLITVVPFMVLCLVIFYVLVVKRRQIALFLITALCFTFSFIAIESAWVIRNKIVLDRIVLFTEPEECFSSFSYNWRELNKIPTAWGYETTRWAGEIDWWYDPQSPATDFPFGESCYTKSFNADSLTALKNEYYLYRFNKDEQTKLNIPFKEKVSKYLSEYKTERPFDYYFVSPAKLLIKFHYKKRIVDIPFPALDKMSLPQKIFKAINWLFILIISVSFLVLSPLFLYLNRNIESWVFILVPFSISFFLVYYGAIEQRYFWAIIPFCIILNAYFIDLILKKVRRSS